MGRKIKLYGFNNLTKTLSFNFYDISYAKSKADKEDYMEYIDERYNSNRLTEILVNISRQIGAHVLNISKQDYEPQGASVNLLITETPLKEEIVDETCNRGIIKSKKIHAHLDKSHITVHTYPEYGLKKSIATFRVDIDVSTCGEISPLRSLNYLLQEFNADFITDIVTIDYHVRGFTRSSRDKKVFNDTKIKSIRQYIDKKYLNKYLWQDFNIPKQNAWFTKLIVKEIKVEDYLFNLRLEDTNQKEFDKISKSIKNELNEIFGSNQTKLVKWRKKNEKDESKPKQKN